MRSTKWIGVVVIAVVASAVLASASHGRAAATLTIRHQVKGCHTWSFNGGAYKASQAVTLAHGTTLTVVNNDVMPHRLVRTSGPAVTILKPLMNRTAAKAHIRFSKAGVYRFKTKAGEDYGWASGMETKGEDNFLRLTVTVR